ncbi:hypothetical protein ACJZ2D_000140 [Fusarium nematophilum]
MDDDLPPDYPELPSYETLDSSANPPAKPEILGPATLYISGRFVYSSSDPQAPPLYEFSHSIGYLRDSDRSIKVERVDADLKASSSPDQPPQLITRNRHLFDLKHPTPAEFPTFEYHAESASRRALCSFGASSFRSGGLLRSRRAYRFQRATRGSDRKFQPQGAGALFEASPSRDRSVGYEWRDGQERLLAREVEDEQEAMSLVVTAEMGVEMRDALVAAWIVRIWWELAKGNYRTMRWEESSKAGSQVEEL